MSGFGGGSLIFNQVITAFINPDNLTPDLITDDGERYVPNKFKLNVIYQVYNVLVMSDEENVVFKHFLC